MRLRQLGLVALVFLAGCGGGDDEGDDGGSERKVPTSPAPKTAIPSDLSGEEREVADAVVGLLEARSGEDACFERLGAEYVESLGGDAACAKRLDPLVTGNINRVASVRVVKPDTEAVAQVSGAGGGYVTIQLSKASTGSWNMTGTSGLPR